MDNPRAIRSQRVQKKRAQRSVYCVPVTVVLFILLPIAPLGYKLGLNSKFYTLNGIILPIIVYICTR